jgi:hypothetical protein
LLASLQPGGSGPQGYPWPFAWAASAIVALASCPAAACQLLSICMRRARRRRRAARRLLAVALALGLLPIFRCCAVLCELRWWTPRRAGRHQRWACGVHRRRVWLPAWRLHGQPRAWLRLGCRTGRPDYLRKHHVSSSLFSLLRAECRKWPPLRYPAAAATGYFLESATNYGMLGCACHACRGPDCFAFGFVPPWSAVYWGTRC